VSVNVLAQSSSTEKHVKNSFQQTLLRYKAMQKQNSKSTFSATIKPRIVGGVDAGIDAYPWMAALLIAEIPDPQWAQFCGGSLVAPDVIVTAAHCMEALPSTDLVDVVVGENDLRTVTPAQRIKILGYAIHPGWDSKNVINDIALIKLSAPLSNHTLKMIEPTQMDGLVAGDLLTAIGFGVLDDVNFTTPDVLQEVQLSLWDHDACNDVYSFLGGINETHLCAGSPNNGVQDSCFGDSGGPLVANIAGEWRLTGIVSWGIGCGLPDFPGVYTKASLYGDWVNSVASSINIDTFSFFDFVGVGEERVIIKSVQNWGNEPRTIDTVTVEDPSLGFSVSETNCLNKQLAPLHSCNLEIKFKPNNEGEVNTHIRISASDASDTSTHMFGIGLAESNAGAALDNKKLNWYSGVSAYWSKVKLVEAIGGSAMQAGRIFDRQFTAVHTHVEGPGSVSFNWKVSAEDYYDYLYLVVDGRIVDAISGETPWMQGQHTISGAGNHAVSWVYLKDESVSSYQDTAWLDAVSWIPENASALNKSLRNIDGVFAESGGGSSGGGSMNLLLLVAIFVSALFRRMR